MKKTRIEPTCIAGRWSDGNLTIAKLETYLERDNERRWRAQWQDFFSAKNEIHARSWNDLKARLSPYFGKDYLTLGRRSKEEAPRPARPTTTAGRYCTCEDYPCCGH